MNIREVHVSDAEKLSTLIQQVDETSEYMLWEPGERNISGDQQEKMIDSFLEKANSTILVAEFEGQLVGYLLAMGGNARRNSHSAYVVLGVLQGYRGHGIGTRLFSELERWATESDIHRLELTTVVRNEAGVSLYKKMGFEIEGTKRDSLFIGGEFVDEYYMSKIL
ncbi:RimJ/RimL family protein N-acetyltransferase [Alkalibacillus filiformis]|uniref:RimJ/RimL family protein N-acetyltransferase n=1 Tax=Alkalibacillus filiformis TaxID=200990 RepID=A0ABU0DSF7_9BACI|nr:GNAT family N-acetyltransferase [Alkalibacillus filiformis]MDQ0351357.1 RimJ/RimL family protein N-acetyltransferase [Alkalibacillus filiformis]